MKGETYLGRKCTCGNSERYVSNDRCVVCRIEKARAWRRANPDAVRASSKRWRAANLEQWKEIQRAWTRLNLADRRKKIKAWRVKNAKRVQIANKAWIEANKEKARAYNKEWRVANADRRAKTNREWRAANLERHTKLSRLWYKNNPDKVRARAHARRARKRNAVGKFNHKDVAQLYANQGGLCLCGTTLFNYHVDHKTPLSRGGSNWPDNLQLLCAPCNDSKGSKLSGVEWMRTAA